MMRFMLTAAAVLLAAAKHLSDDELVALYGRKVHTEPVKLRVPKDATQTLRDAAAAKGIFIGAAISVSHFTNTTDLLYNVTARTQFNLLTAENECKWGATEPSKNGVYTLQSCQTIASYALENGMAHRLHNLDWGVDNPSWLTNPPSPWNPSVLNTTMTSHATTLVQAFAPGGALPAYCTDTVNEAITDDNDPSIIFKPADPWYPALPDYVATQFYAARAADPSAHTSTSTPSTALRGATTTTTTAAAAGPMKLFYNEYGAEGSGAKSDKVYNMVKSFLERGVPIDGVGFQMHISVDAYPAPSDVSANMARLVALGMEVHITEMDVRCTPPCGSDRLAIQAKIYGDMLQACLNNTQATHPSGKGGCKSFEMWGVTDLYTWLWDFQNPNHLDMQPLLFDMQYNPKPAFYEVLAVLQA